MENIIYVIFCLFIVFCIIVTYKIFNMINQINSTIIDMNEFIEDIKSEQEYLMIDIVNKKDDLEYLVKDLECDINENIDTLFDALNDRIDELNKRIEELEQRIIDLLIDENE